MSETTIERKIDQDKLNALARPRRRRPLRRLRRGDGQPRRQARAVPGDGGRRARSARSELAARAGCAERYVREWLNAQVAGGYVDYHAVSGTYELSPAGCASGRARSCGCSPNSRSTRSSTCPSRSHRRRGHGRRWLAASYSGMYPSSVDAPFIIGTPATATLSFTARVRPASGPSSRPRISVHQYQPLYGLSSARRPEARGTAGSGRAAARRPASSRVGG